MRPQQGQGGINKFHARLGPVQMLVSKTEYHAELQPVSMLAIRASSVMPGLNRGMHEQCCNQTNTTRQHSFCNSDLVAIASVSHVKNTALQFACGHHSTWSPAKGHDQPDTRLAVEGSRGEHALKERMPRRAACMKESVGTWRRAYTLEESAEGGEHAPQQSTQARDH
eukprot:1158857-Pelagomonas_calceolata.AAC.6